MLLLTARFRAIAPCWGGSRRRHTELLRPARPARSTGMGLLMHNPSAAGDYALLDADNCSAPPKRRRPRLVGTRVLESDMLAAVSNNACR
jgi:hypothetical protein